MILKESLIPLFFTVLQVFLHRCVQDCLPVFVFHTQTAHCSAKLLLSIHEWQSMWKYCFCVCKLLGVCKSG